MNATTAGPPVAATDFGIRKVARRSYREDTLTRVPEALQSEGFGVLTEIDVKDARAEARCRLSALQDPRSLQPAVRAPGARGGARGSASCCRATSSSTTPARGRPSFARSIRCRRSRRAAPGARRGGRVRPREAAAGARPAHVASARRPRPVRPDQFAGGGPPGPSSSGSHMPPSPAPARLRRTSPSSRRRRRSTPSRLPPCDPAHPSWGSRPSSRRRGVEGDELLDDRLERRDLLVAGSFFAASSWASICFQTASTLFHAGFPGIHRL